MEARARRFNALFSGLKPDPTLSISEWADKHRTLSQKAAAEPGRWRTSRTPYLKEIMDCLSPSSPVERVVFMKGTQIGATETGGNWIGYVISHAPGPMLIVMPTVDTAKRWSKQRLAPMIDEMPILRAKVAPSRERDSGNTLQMKEFVGGFLIITGANSAVGLRSTPIRNLFLDEIDGYPSDVEGEGDPVKLAEKRTDTFSRRKIFMASTPTIKDASRIEREYEASDKRRYYVPCPHCEHMQWLKWINIKWPENKPDEAAYACEACGALIEEHNKTWMLEHGEWRAEAVSKTAGFHLSSLYSPLGWKSWAAIASDFLESKNDPALLKTWVNTVLGETWAEIGDAPKWETVAALREAYLSTDKPDGANVITCGVDVQKDRLVYGVRGWGEVKESWGMHQGELWGETDRIDVWNDLAVLLETAGIDRMLIDSGYRPEMVYQFCRRFPEKALPTKGHDTADKPLKASKIDLTSGGRVIKAGITLWHIDTGYFKSWVHGRINWPAASPGAWHLPADATLDYCKQVVAESLIVSPNGKKTWKRHEKDNHFLDVEVLNAAAAEMLQHKLKKIKTSPAESGVFNSINPFASEEWSSRL